MSGHKVAWFGGRSIVTCHEPVDADCRHVNLFFFFEGSPNLHRRECVHVVWGHLLRYDGPDGPYRYAGAADSWVITQRDGRIEFEHGPHVCTWRYE